MFSAALYARARNLLLIAHGTSGAARIRHSLRPLISRGRENYLQTSGVLRRENAFSYPAVCNGKSVLANLLPDAVCYAGTAFGMMLFLRKICRPKGR